MLEQELEHSILVGLEYTDAFYPALYSVSHRPWLRSSFVEYGE